MGNEASKEQEAADAAAAEEVGQSQDDFDLDAISDHAESLPADEVPLPSPEQPPPLPTDPDPQSTQSGKNPASKKMQAKAKRRAWNGRAHAPIKFTPWHATEEEQQRVRLESPEMHDEYFMSESSVLGDDAHLAFARRSEDEDEEEDPPISHSVVEMEFAIEARADEEQEDVSMVEQHEEEDAQLFKENDSENESEPGAGQISQHWSDDNSVVKILNGEDCEDDRQKGEHDEILTESSSKEVESEDSTDAQTANAVEHDSDTGDTESTDTSSEADGGTFDATVNSEVRIRSEPGPAKDILSDDSDNSDEEAEVQAQQPGALSPTHLDPGQDEDESEDPQGSLASPASLPRRAARFDSVEIPRRHLPARQLFERAEKTSRLQITESEVGKAWPKSLLRCPHCASAFMQKYKFDRHLLSHGPPQFYCPFCGDDQAKRFNRKDKTIDHIKRCHSPSELAEARMMSLRIDEDTQPPEIAGTAEIWTETAPSKAQNLNTDLDHYFSCPYMRIFACNETFPDRDAIERHCSSVHEVDLCCPACDKLCTDEKHLFSHKIKFHSVWELQEARIKIEASMIGSDDESWEGLASDSDPSMQHSESQNSPSLARPVDPKINEQQSVNSNSDPGRKFRAARSQDKKTQPDDAQGFPYPYAEKHGCRKSFKRKKTALRHGKTHEWEFPCICDRVYPRKDALMVHFNSVHPQSEKNRLEPRAKLPVTTRPDSHADASTTVPVRPPSEAKGMNYQPPIADSRDDAIPVDAEDLQLNTDGTETETAYDPPQKRKRNSCENLSDKLATEGRPLRKKPRNRNVHKTFTLEIPPGKLVDRLGTRANPPALTLGEDKINSGLASAHYETPTKKSRPRAQLQSEKVAQQGGSDTYEDDSDSYKPEVMDRNPRAPSRRVNSVAPSLVIHTLRDGSEDHELHATVNSDADDAALFCTICHKSFRSARSRKEHDKDKNAHKNLEECDICGRCYHSYSALREHKIDARHYSARGERSKATGRFTDLEVKRLNEWRQQICREHGLDKARFNDLMSSTKKRGSSTWPYKFISRRDLLDLFYEVLPNRAHKSMQLYRDTHFHNGDKSTEWAPEDDRDILRLHKELGPKWVEIGARISRTPVDVRRRFQSKLQYSGALEHGEWSKDEDVRFDEAIEEVKNIIGRPAGDNFNWQAVSQKVGTRTPIQCANHWRSRHGTLVGNRWRKPQHQRSSQRPRSKMETRLSGVPISKGRPSDLSAEYIVDSDEEAGLVATPADGGKNPSQDVQHADDQHSANSHEETSDEEGRLPQNPLPNRTPENAMSLSQTFKQTQANTSAVRRPARISRNILSQDRPSPAVAIQYRPARSTPQQLFEDSPQPIAKEAEMVDAPHAGPADYSDSSEGGADSDSNSDSASVTSSKAALQASLENETISSSEINGETAVSAEDELASSKVRVKRMPQAALPVIQYGAEDLRSDDDDSDENDPFQPATQTPLERKAASTNKPSSVDRRTMVSIRTPELPESSSGTEDSKYSSSDSGSESEAVPTKWTLKPPQWRGTPAMKQPISRPGTEDFITSVQTTAKMKQKRFEMARRSQRRDSTDDDSD